MPTRLRWRLFLLILLSLSFPLFAQDEPLTLDDPEEEEFIRRKAEEGESHASGMKPEMGPTIVGNPTSAVRIIRVGISPSRLNPDGTLAAEYSTTAPASATNPAHTFAEVSHTAGTVHVLDLSTQKQIIDIEPGTIVRVAHVANAGYAVSIAGAALGTFEGPIFFRPTDAANLFRIETIRRSFGGIQVPRYRGAIEVTRGSSLPAAGLVYVVNIVEIEDYVPGVVANESIASFHMEALKAQAVASRGYAIANIGRNMASRNFDVFDSTSSQVYRGVISEHVRAVQAATETTGIVGSYAGKIIEALYSSSFGGRSESSEYGFTSNPPSTNVIPYLRGIYDGDALVVPDPVDETFWKNVSQPNVYDDCERVRPPANSFSRWSYQLTGSTIKARLTGSFFVLTSGNISGAITNVEVVKRGHSGRVAVAKITFTTGTAEVRGWDNLRFVFRPSANVPRACGGGVFNMVMTNPSLMEVNRDALGNFVNLSVWGGGWGHNMGMSQYGGHGRAKSGQSFLQIMKGYYTGIDVGTYPIDIGREPGSGPPTLRHTFYAATPSAKLVVRATGMKKLMVHINETTDIALDEETLASGTVTIDVSPYLVAGFNTLQYNPAGRDGQATVIVALD